MRRGSGIGSGARTLTRRPVGSARRPPRRRAKRGPSRGRRPVTNTLLPERRTRTMSGGAVWAVDLALRANVRLRAPEYAALRATTQPAAAGTWTAGEYLADPKEHPRYKADRR